MLVIKVLMVGRNCSDPTIVAGWRSGLSHWVHTPEISGSNPLPAISKLFNIIGAN